MSVTINADDPRTIRAIEIAAEADHWLSGRNPQGEDVFGVPSQHDPRHYYIVTRATCDCPDFRNHGTEPCKHVLAVRLHEELLRAERSGSSRQPAPAPARRRGHLSVVPHTS
ncbi:MAG: SWIM zinc finger family protein [Chloroflexi bacterium]|nr:SWIM zinc finger family protein [Chloroflexota bacterium]